MADIGYLCIWLAIASAVFAIAANLLGVRRRYPELVASGEQAVVAAAGLTSLAAGFLVLLFLMQDYQVNYVAAHSSRAMPLLFRLSALWSGQEGSLLFWAWILSLYSLVVVYFNRNQHRAIMPYTLATLMTVLAFFLSLVALIENPFKMLDFVPQDGNGLNPLLQHWAMAIHPPMLYIGFVGTTVPFAFAMGALAANRTGSEWVQLARRWALLVWTFLTIGIMLGGAWAYMELGWGGYWGWDPVENASFLPWLAGTAFVHSIIVQERRGMLKIWNFILVGLFFGLAIFGTFLTRSGVVSSVHSFAQSPLGPYFVGFITFIMLVFLGLLIMRWEELRSPNKLESPVSRETAFLMNNLVLLAIIFAVFWGTIFPMISEIVVGDKITVGPPYFNQITIPLFGALLVLMGIAPMTSWGRATLSKLVRNLALPFIASGVITLVLFLLGLHGPALIAYAIILFVLAVHVDEFYSGSRVYHAATGANWPKSLVATVRRNRRRYGGYIVHLGILVIAIGVVASNVFQLERQATLKKGETMTVGDFSVQYQDMQGLAFPDRDVTVALVRASQNGRDLGLLMPSQDLYRATNQPQTEVAIRRSPTEDLYIVLGGWEAKGDTATFKVFVNPLVSWVWGGGLVVVLGILVAAWPDGRRRTSTVRIPEAVPAK